VFAWVIAALLVTAVGQAEPFDPLGHDWEGYADFVDLARSQLGDVFAVVPSVNFDELKPGDALILVHPERRLDTSNLSAFLSAGGRVVLLDDFGAGDGLLRRFGIRRAPIPATPAETLRHNPDLAIAVPVGTHALTLGVTRVVTNHASAVVESSLTPLLEIRSLDGDPALVAMLGVVSKGAFVVVADPSAFMNAMLRYPGNERLGENLIGWSSRGPDGKRSGRVYFAYGDFQELGSFAGPSDLAGAARDARAAAAFLGPVSLGTRGAHLLAAFVGLLVVVWIGSRAGRTYRIVRPRLTRPLALFAQGGSAGRAADLGARKASRDRALLELGKALEEELTLALGLDRVPAHDLLVIKLESKGLLDRESSKKLHALFSRIAHIDTLTSAGRAYALPRVRDAEVLAAAKVVKQVLGRVNANAREGRAA
jgi:hypothetical protein